MTLFAMLFLIQQTTTHQNMTVIATRTEKDIQKVPGSVTILDQNAILKKAASGNLADALEDVPGIELYDVSVPGAKRIGIRGEHGTRVLILVDGQRISEQKSMDGAPLLVSLDEVEKIEILRGPSSVLYGSDALGGVINIQTKAAGSKAIGGSISTGYNDSAEGKMGSIQLSGSQNDWSYRVSGNTTEFGDRETPEGTLDHSGYETQGFQASLAKSFDLSQVKLSYEDFNGSMESASIDLAPPMTRFFIDLPNWDREKVSLSWADSTTRGSLIRLQANAFYQKTHKDFLNGMAFQFGPGPEATLDITTANQLETTGFQLQTDWSFANHLVTAGVEGFSDDLDSHEQQTQIGFGPAPIEVDFTYRAKLNQVALYVHDDWSINQNFSTFFGVRQTYNKYELADTDNPILELESQTQNEPVLSLGGVFSHNAHTVRGQWSQGFRIATLQQLFIGTSHGSRTPTLPNPELDPETSNNFDLGYRFLSQNTTIDFGIFYANAEDYITTALESGVRTYVNVDQAESYGSELSITQDLSERWHAHLSAASLRRAYESAGVRSYNTGHPDFTGSLGLNWEAIQGPLSLDIGALIRHAGEAQELSGEDLYETPSWTTSNLNLTLGWEGRVPGSFSLGLNNLADKSYRVATETVQSPGRHVTAHVNIRF